MFDYYQMAFYYSNKFAGENISVHGLDKFSKSWVVNVRMKELCK